MRCKVGDLAIVIRSQTPANLGRVVVVLRHAIYPAHTTPNGLLFHTENLPSWEVQVFGETPLTLINWEASYSCPSEYAVCQDDCLQPLPGESVREIQRDEVSVS